MLKNIQASQATIEESILLMAIWNNEGHSRSCVCDWVGCLLCSEQVEAIFDQVFPLLPYSDRIFFQFACLVGNSAETGRIAPVA